MSQEPLRHIRTVGSPPDVPHQGLAHFLSGLRSRQSGETQNQLGVLEECRFLGLTLETPSP